MVLFKTLKDPSLRSFFIERTFTYNISVGASCCVNLSPSLLHETAVNCIRNNYMPKNFRNNILVNGFTILRKII